MESNFDPVLLKNKFSSLIAILHDIGFTDDFITMKLMNDPFFSCFEENNYLVFLKKPVEEIISTVFNRTNIIVNYDRPFISEYYWAGSMYFILLSEYHIPLERILLVYSLSDMVNLFNPYHEMPINALYNRYIKDENETSILKKLKKINNLSTRKLSLLTGITERTITSYSDNGKLFEASFNNICLLSQALNVKISIFKKKSSFIMISDYFIYDRENISRIKNKLIEYFGLNEDTVLIDSYKTSTELLEIGKKYRTFIYLPDLALVKYRNKLDYTILSNSEIELLFSSM